MSNTMATGGETPSSVSESKPSFADGDSTSPPTVARSESPGRTDAPGAISEAEQALREQSLKELEEGGSRRFGRKRRSEGPKDKPEKPKNPAQVKREERKKKRAMQLGVRYGGDRTKWFLLQAGLAFLVLGSLASLLISMGKASKNDVAAEVERALAASGQDFPRGQAVMWAGQVLRVWGTWDEADTASRELALSPYLSSGMPPGAGWNGKGKQTVTYASINPQPRVSDANHATVDAVYQVQDGTWRCVGLPIFAYKPAEFSRDAAWAFTLAGNPSPVPCTPRTGVQPMTNAEDPLTAGGMQPNADIGRNLAADFFPGFFAAWAASDESALTQFTASGVRTVGLGGAMASLPQPSIGETSVFIDKDGPVEGKTYKALVPVTWTVAGSTSQITATYVVPVQRNGDRWVVAGEPMPSMQSPEANGRAPAGIPEPGQGVKMPTYPTPSVSPSTAPPTSNPKSTDDASPTTAPTPTNSPSASVSSTGEGTP